MKKIYIFLSVAILYTSALIGISSEVSAQEFKIGSLSPLGVFPIFHQKVRDHSIDNSSMVTGRWLSYWSVEDSLSKLAGNIPSAVYEFLFPDSTVIACGLSGGLNICHYVDVQLIGNVLDPNSPDMRSIYGYSWSNSNPYTVDSLGIFYHYEINDNTVVDTLVVYLWNNVDTNNINTHAGVVDPNKGDYGVDTLHFGLLPYDTLNLSANMPGVSAGALQIFKIPLSISDTSSVGAPVGLKVINTNHFAVPAGKLVASAFGFIPGYVYYPGETITTTENAFAFISDQPNGVNSYAPYTAGDWNSSSIVDNSIRYNINPLGFNGSFIPTFAFADDYQTQEHEISYYVTGVFDVGVKESVSASGTTLYQNQPNPANHTTLISYNIKNESAITLEVTDLTGRIIMTMDQGNQPAGLHSATIDLSRLSQGIYMYTLRTNCESLTKRMVITE